MWLIKVPQFVTVFLFQLRRIALGEFFDDISLSQNVLKIFGLSSEELKNDKSRNFDGGQPTGEQRLGSSNVF